MKLIDKFKNIPTDVYYLIISYLPVKKLDYTNCIDQIKNMNECLEDYKRRDINRWIYWSFKQFALEKNRNKKLLNSCR